jgi:hypothetical protein
MGIAGIASLKNEFDTTEHLTGAPGIGNLAPSHLNLDAKVTLDSGNRVDYDTFSHIFNPSLFS